MSYPISLPLEVLDDSSVHDSLVPPLQSVVLGEVNVFDLQRSGSSVRAMQCDTVLVVRLANTRALTAWDPSEAVSCIQEHLEARCLREHAG